MTTDCDLSWKAFSNGILSTYWKLKISVVFLSPMIINKVNVDKFKLMGMCLYSLMVLYCYCSWLDIYIQIQWPWSKWEQTWNRCLRTLHCRLTLSVTQICQPNCLWNTLSNTVKYRVCNASVSQLIRIQLKYTLWYWIFVVSSLLEPTFSWHFYFLIHRHTDGPVFPRGGLSHLCRKIFQQHPKKLLIQIDQIACCQWNETVKIVDISVSFKTALPNLSTPPNN